MGVVVADAPSLGTDEVDGSAYLQDVLNLSMELDPAESGEAGGWRQALPSAVGRRGGRTGRRRGADAAVPSYRMC